MKRLLTLSTLLSCLALASLPASVAEAAKPPAMAAPKTDGEVFDRQLSIIEGQLVALVEAMPADKFDFVPAGDGFKDSRTFKQQVGHLGAALQMVSSLITGEKPALAMADMASGPATLKGKDETVAFLKESFAKAHAAARSVQGKQRLQEIETPMGFKATRVALASMLTWHSFDHYGQLVVYARLNGVVPPASQPHPAPSAEK